jgi:multidrug resistance efflux pump
LRRRLKTLEAKLNEAEEKLKETEDKLQNSQRPKICMLSPVAQAIEIAKSELKRLRNTDKVSLVRKKPRTDIDWNQMTY